MKLYIKYLAVHLKCQMQYKASFFMTVIGQFLISFSALLSIYFLMSRFHRVAGFTYSEVLLCFSVITMAFSLSECFVRGFDAFGPTVQSGMFDRFLLMPRSEILTVLCSKADFSRLGKLVQAAVVLAFAIPSCGVSWTPDKILLLCLMILSGIAVFSGLFIIYASVCFFTVEGLEFMNIFTDGGKEFGVYPLAVYGKGVLKFFTYVVPLALVQYYPFLYLTERVKNVFCFLCPLAAMLFVIPCLAIWKFGVRHYQSTGS